MSPVPRLARRVTFLAFLLVAATSVALAQDAPSGIDRVITVGAYEDEAGCAPLGGGAQCWDQAVLVANPGDSVTLRADLRNTLQPHNVHITEGVEGAPKTPLASGQLHELKFTMPDGEVTFVCDAHPTMTATIMSATAAAEAGGGGHESVPRLGVNFLAYWVGVIAFALMFVVYGLTFFLFKYNETSATTDQWDRADAGTEDRRRFGAGATSLLALVFAAVLIGAIIYLARAA